MEINTLMTKFLFMAADLNASQQAELFEKIGSFFTQEELQALKIGIAYFRLLKFPELNQAIKADVCNALYQQFTNLQLTCN